MKALVTGSGGLIGSECVRFLCEEGWDVAGIDNDMRRSFFGEQASTRPNVERLVYELPAYRHHGLDIRDREGIRGIVKSERPDFIIHAAAQPSHDKAASIPYDDFDINAVGTMNLLVAARDFCAATGARRHCIVRYQHGPRLDCAQDRSFAHLQR